ncbi:MCE family protein [Nocardia neocaledoniensis]|uniref:MCE family protein n=1 Tax=Nocardia neocaledoniensis TaxID=236511 RepID=UPI002454FEEC|nr:MCE family protein [Nocardia neocaledoniensis]
MTIRRPLIGFAVFAVASALVTVTVWNTLSRTVDGSTNTYSATFSDVLGLNEGDDVRMAGVRVGKVKRIELDERNKARVTFVVQRSQTLFANSKALVRYQNLVGQRYVALTPGVGGDTSPLADHGKIPISQTEPSFDISGLLNGFQPLFQALQPEQVNDLASSLIQALQGDGVSLSAFIVQAATLARDFHLRDEVVSEVIANLSAVMHSLAQRGSELETLVTQTRALIGGLQDQGRTLEHATAGIATATETLVALLTQVQPMLAAAQNSTREALTLMLANGAKLDEAAPHLSALLAGIGRVTAEGTHGNAYLCGLDISLYDIVLPRGLISQIGGNAHTEVCR